MDAAPVRPGPLFLVGVVIGERDYGGAGCQSLSAGRLESFVSEAMLSVLSPLSAELSIDAVADAEAERARLHEQWQLRIARAEQEAEAARRVAT